VQTCGVCSKQSPDQETTCSRCGSDLREKSLTALALKTMQANDRVRLVRVSVAADCCPACAAVQGSHPKDNVPALPVEGCSHANGCRCFYEPVLTEIFP
jgi:hypothetical protein